MNMFPRSGTIKLYAHSASFIPDDTSQELALLALEDVKGYLHNHVKFDEGKVRIGSLLDLMLTDPDFYSHVIGVDVKAFLHGIQLSSEQEQIQEKRFGDKVDTLEVAWCADCDNFTGNKEFDFNARLNGWGKNEAPYDMGMSPLIESINLPIILNNEVVVYTSEYSCKEEHEHDYGTCGTFIHKQHAFGTKAFTLLEVLRAIFFDLTCFGLPGSQEKQEIGAELDEGLKGCELSTGITPEDIVDSLDYDDELQNDDGPEDE